MHQIIKYDIDKNFKKYFQAEAQQNEIYNKYFIPLYSQKEGEVHFKSQKNACNQIIS